MRTTLSFLIGCVMGATGILLYLTETRRPVTARPEGAGVVASRPVVERPAAITPAAASSTLNAVPDSAAPDLIIPVEGVSSDALRSSFDQNRGAFRRHRAIDILAPRGTAVRAAVAGTIRKLFVSGAGGITIYQFDQGSRRCYYYAHLDRYAGSLREGMTVEQGDVIGFVGTTGNAPRGTPHLHFAVTLLPPSKDWWKGEPVDPYPLLMAAAERDGR